MASSIQNAFNAGEFSSLMLGRQDVDKYARALYVCLNGIPLVQGAWTRRPGTAFLHQTKYHNRLSRALPFQYSVTQTYVLEFGHQYIRFFTQHGILTLASQSITSVTQANPGVVTKNAHGYSNGDRLQLSSVTGMTQLNNREVVVTNNTVNTFELWDSDGNKINTTNYDAFTAGNMAKIFEVTTTYTESDLANIRITQSADTLYILHPNYKPKTLVRVSALVWTLSDIVFTDGPYDVANTTSTTLTPSSATDVAATNVTGTANNGSGAIRVTSAAHGLVTGDAVLVASVGGTTEANGYWKVTQIDVNNVDLVGSTFTNAWTSGGTVTKLVKLTASSTTGINTAGFVSTDVDRLIRLKEGSTWGYGQIKFCDSTTVVWVDVFSTLTNMNAKTNWRLGIWSATTGYPTCGAFFENRLWLAGASSYPQRIDGSNSSLYTNFSPSATDGTVSDSNAVSFAMNSDDVNAIQWIATNEKGLFVGTTRGEWWVRASALNVAITPTNISAKPSTRYGSASAAPVTVGNATLFIQRASRKLRELAYVFEIDGLRAPDMSLLASHITLPTLTQIAHQGQPQSIIWGVRSDGVLVGFTYEREQSVTAWHRHQLGGQSDAAKTLIPVVESVCCVAAPDASRDELYLIVQRYINGGTKRYIEYMSKLWESGDHQENAFYADCGWTVINGSPASVVTGLWHLEGETIGVYIDGMRHPGVTVTNGKATLTRTGTIITLGYFYNSDGQTMPVEAGAQEGTSQGKIKRITRIGFWLLDTLGFKYGPDVADLTEVIERQWGDAYGAATPLFTGVTRERFEGDYDRLGQAYWRVDGPFPATVLAVMPQIEVADGS